MLRNFAILIAVLALGFGGCAGSRTGDGGDAMHIGRPGTGNDDPAWYDEAWARVDSLDSKELPRSALEVVGEIYETARVSNNEPQLVKSLLYRARYRAAVEDNSINAIVFDLREHAASTSAPTAAVLNSVLGDVLWGYLQANRYRLYGRTAVAPGDAGRNPDNGPGPDGPGAGGENAGVVEDILTWDLSRLVSESLAAYRASLREADTLLATPVEAYEVLLIEAEAGRRQRPTLFDLLAHRALDVLENTESGLAQPIEPFTVDASTHLAPAETFVGQSIDTPDTLSTTAAALRILQSLVRAHLDDEDPSAEVHADLRRLQFVRERGLEEDGTPYVEALEALAVRHAGSEVEAGIRYAIAAELLRQGHAYQPLESTRFKWKKRDALEVCAYVVRRFPGSAAATNCAALSEGIRSSTLDLASGGVVIPGRHSLMRVTFRNVPTLYVRVYRLGEREARRWSLSRPRGEEERTDGLVRDSAAVLSTEYVLPIDGDYQTHHTELVLPPLDEGAYLVVAGDRSDLGREDGVRFVGRVLASSLSFFHRNEPDGTVAVNVVDRGSGQPLRDVKVTPFAVTRAREVVLDARNPATTDAGGRVVLKLSPRQAFLLDFRRDGAWLVSESTVATYDVESIQRSHPVTRFFTDRAIYRPGQQVHFKAILLKQKGDRYTIRPDAPTAVRMLDVNGREVGRLELRSNEFGTVAGQFTAPTSGLTGHMTIMDDHGSESISVEEYKRPRFEVTLHPFDGIAAVGDLVALNGSAKSFAGAAVDRARVAYRVRRSVWFPWYRGGWGRIAPRGQDAEIARGVVETDADGWFEVSFSAAPDPEVRVGSLPVYNYTVSVDVTDLAGETQSTESVVRIGERSLLLDVKLDGDVIDRRRLDSLVVSTTTLDGRPVAADGQIRVLRLEEPRAQNRPDWQAVDTLSISREEWEELLPNTAYPGQEDPASWPVAAEVLSSTFQGSGEEQGAGEGDGAGEGEGKGEGPGVVVRVPDAATWQPGMYRILLSARDQQGREVTSTRHVRVFDAAGDVVPGEVVDWFHLVRDTVEPGDEAVVVFGSSEQNAHILIETEVRGAIVASQWMRVSGKQASMRIPIVEDHRGNIAVHGTMVRDGRLFAHAATVRVPWTNKQLSVKWGTFRDLLEPGQEETWTLRISGPRGEAVAAELVAAMYDASLDQFRPHDWSLDLWPRYGPMKYWSAGDYHRSLSFARYSSFHPTATRPVWRAYDQLNLFGLLAGRRGVEYERMLVRQNAVDAPVPDAMAGVRGDRMLAEAAVSDQEALDKVGGADDDMRSAGGDEAVTQPLRSNFDETALFMPQLRVGDDGETVLSFKMPESLTRWRFLGLAHTVELQTGSIVAEVQTRKELMITTNAPRFLRQGDSITLTAAVDNLSDVAINGTAQLRLTNALTGEPVATVVRTDGQNGERVADGVAAAKFETESGQSASVAWRFSIPDGVEAVRYRVGAESERFQDGEEAVLPVLTNRMLVTESLPLPMRGPGTKEFRFDRLVDASSETLKHERVFLEYTANPVWYAVQALPYLMEYPYECAEQVFARLYANGVATYIVDQNPAIKDVFAAWQRDGAPTMLSNLERNQDLKSLLLEETPWVRQAASESERKRRIAALFDLVRMRGELASAITRLDQLQLGDGSWPWFGGGGADRYITQHIVKGIGTMDRIGVLDLLDDARPREMARRAVAAVDAGLERDYARLLERKADLDKQQVGWIQLHALYARSFFPDVAIQPSAQKAHDYFLGQVDRYGLSFEALGEGMAALVLHRSGHTERALELIASLRETARQSEELGMYWATPHGWWWYEAPIETQALLIEAFREVAADAASLEAMQLWLLKQKQTRDWKTTRATTDAIYALLHRGVGLLENPGSVEIALAGQTVSSTAPGAEAATGYITAGWTGASITPSLGEVTVTKRGPGPAWGALYWQYFEDLDRITAAATPLQLEKELYVTRDTDAGRVLDRITTESPLHPGDLVTVRVILRSDRDMEYVHLKDMRASGFEPVSVLSQYKWTDGLGYYESTRDAATNFFISYLARGTYVFEYELRVRHAGDFSNGVTSIQSMYAPEFAAHSSGIRVRVVER